MLKQDTPLIDIFPHPCTPPTSSLRHFFTKYFCCILLLPKIAETFLPDVFCRSISLKRSGRCPVSQYIAHHLLPLPFFPSPKYPTILNRSPGKRYIRETALRWPCFTAPVIDYCTVVRGRGKMPLFSRRRPGGTGPKLSPPINTKSALILSNEALSFWYTL